MTPHKELRSTLHPLLPACPSPVDHYLYAHRPPLDYHGLSWFCLNYVTPMWYMLIKSQPPQSLMLSLRTCNITHGNDKRTQCKRLQHLQSCVGCNSPFGFLASSIPCWLQYTFWLLVGHIAIEQSKFDQYITICCFNSLVIDSNVCLVKLSSLVPINRFDEWKRTLLHINPSNILRRLNWLDAYWSLTCMAIQNLTWGLFI